MKVIYDSLTGRYFSEFRSRSTSVGFKSYADWRAAHARTLDDRGPLFIWSEDPDAALDLDMDVESINYVLSFIGPEWAVYRGPDLTSIVNQILVDSVHDR